ncbi:DNA-binding transcriptional repressor MarR [Thalassovita gelatinovora]|uniref:DNA-binding transcriptional repressor MarR n=1 Tax=Thalassovita gelatinovora TaxID=53501 RepID=A0A0N7LVW3_THAGE|nr:MarR family winged helix-turn-helix transcriptional regulator [Thalassovita gelatinovora]QIZ81980.1 winged helix-turn-helix transcriptional regulator [Thalassovita gelatinovora]CUH67418.1 DNA-binding transcriptional repressor MarR [Thalassovita gelatinovora]SEP74482.1 DNA-binding transcriptional regulator, MarR family [Thalassovita gelatinovora]
MQTDQHDFHGLLHSADLIEAELRRKLAPLNIQPRQARVLDAMGRMGAVSQSDLASQFGVTSASMSTMTDRLLAAGYITRAIDPASRRRHVLELTGKGHALLAGIVDAWSDVDAAIQSVLGSDAATFFDLARRLRDGFGGTIPGTKDIRAPTVITG